MTQTLAGLGLKLHDFGDARGIAALDQDRILADLRQAGAPSRQLIWLAHRPLDSFNRILMAHDSRTGACHGLLLGEDRPDGREPCLLVEAIVGGPRAYGEALLQRMIAFLLLRLELMEQRPAAILARSRDTSLCRVLHTMAAGIPNMGFYPAPDDGPIAFHIAALAHRVARLDGHVSGFELTRQLLSGRPITPADRPMLAAIDLRHIDEARMVDAARLLFRARVPRAARRAAAPAVLPMVRIAGR